MPLPLVEVAERSEDGEGLPLPLGEVAERSEDGEGEDGASVPQAERFFIFVFLKSDCDSYLEVCYNRFQKIGEYGGLKHEY